MDHSLVIFDCDGVLVDSEIISCQIAAAEFGKHGFQVSYEDYVRLFAGKSRAAVMAQVEVETRSRLPEGFSDHLEGLILSAFSKNLKPIENVTIAINATQFRCIASSSSLNRINHSLNVTDLANFFQSKQIFSAAMVKHGKPAPDLFLFAAQEMGFSPQNCIVVEDSISGVKAAVAANMFCIGFTGGTHIRNPRHKDEMLANGAKAVFPTMSMLSHYLHHMPMP